MSASCQSRPHALQQISTSRARSSPRLHRPLTQPIWIVLSGEGCLDNSRRMPRRQRALVIRFALAVFGDRFGAGERDTPARLLPCFLEISFGAVSSAFAIQVRNALPASLASSALLTPSSRHNTSAASPPACWSICSRIKAAASSVERTKVPRRPRMRIGGSITKSVMQIRNVRPIRQFRVG
jgi:hypothetical protein